MKCKQCQKEFEAKRKNATFCSKECSDLYFKTYRESWRKNNPKVEGDYTKSGIRAYNNIKQRTTNTKHPSFASYGGRGIKLELTKEQFVEIYFATDKCEMCGVSLDDKNRNGPNGRTLDRIDVSQGYKEGNLRLLCRSCNASLSFRRKKQRGNN